jgi:PAS domain S-box-containing protein
MAKIRKLLPSGGYLTWLVYLLLLAFIIFLGIGVVFRFSQGLKAQQENLRYRHQEALLSLEAEMKSALNTIEGLRTAAETDYLNPPEEKPSPYYEMLASRPDQDGYALEQIQPPFSRNQLANLTGLGKLERDDASFRREIEMALSLTPLFEWAKQTHPAAPWVYYTSARDFISMYPWVSADDFFFTPALHEHGFFTGGLPENNPNRQSFITEVYLDEAGQGLMVSIAAPVYEGDTFRGTAALDFTLASLNQFFAQPQDTSERAFIVNDRGQVVALSSATTMEEILGIADVLPELNQDPRALLDLPSGQVHTLNQDYAFVQPIQNTPWTYVAVISRSYILFQAAKDVAPMILMILVLMIAMVFVRQRALQERKLRTLEARRLAEERKAQAEILERERRFRALVEAAPDGIIIVNQEQNIVFVNDQLERMFGYPGEEIIGQPFNKLLPNHPADWDAFFSMPEKETLEQQCELQGQRKDGSGFPINVSSNSLEMQDGQAIIAIIHDISKRKQAEAERDRLQQEIIKAQQQTIQEISTPVIPVLNTSQGGIIVMPMVGAIDSMRARDVTRSLLAGISRHKARIVILDVTGVSLMDTGIVNHLSKTIQAAQLKGAQTIVTGISDVVAESIVDLGIDWSDITTLSDLQSGLRVALKNVGLELNQA